MAQLDTNASILVTTFTPEEEKQARQLSPLQIMALKNDEAMAVRSLTQLEFDPQNPVRFAQDQATLQAQIKFIQYLLAQHDFVTTPVSTTSTQGE